MWIKRIIGQLLMMACIFQLGGFLGGTLERRAPGFGVDEQELDTRLSGVSIRSLRQARDSEKDIGRFYIRFLTGLLTRDLGVSRSLGPPVSELLTDRGWGFKELLKNSPN